MDFKGKTVIVTGASSGIGLATAREFSRVGANVVLAARNIERLREIESELPRALAIECDVTSQDQCRRMVERAVERFGGVDILINNAGLSMRALLEDAQVEVLRRLMEVNFWGTVYCTKYALPYIQASRGSVVGVSSVAGFHGLPARTGYSASKYAMQGFLETVRIENLKKGVHVMIVAPGFTESNVRFSALTADGTTQGASPRKEDKMMSAQSVGRSIVRGCARRKRQMMLDVDGKATVWLKFFAPRLLDRLYYNHMAKEPNSPLRN